MSSTDHHRRGLIPFLPRVPLPPNPLKFLPNPLAWVPRPRIFGGGRTARKALILTAGAGVATAAESAASTSGACSSTPLVQSKVPLKPASDVFAGALARAASQSTIHPLDTLKVRLQTSVKGRTSSPPSGLSKIAQLMPPALPGAASSSAVIRAHNFNMDLRALGQNVSSLYRGVFGAASGAGIAIGAYFAFYGVACNTISRAAPDLPAASVAFGAGGVAALGSSFVKVPLAVCIRSVQAGVYPNFIEAAKSIFKAVGPRGLFTGYLPTVLEDVPDMAIKFAAYESMRGFHAQLFHGRTASLQEDFMMGAISGAAAAAATTPLDVIKTNMMCTAASRPSMLGAAMLVHSQGGPAAFFRGIGARALSNGINSAVFFCFFEALRSSIAARKILQQQQQLQKDRVVLDESPLDVHDDLSL